MEKIESLKEKRLQGLLSSTKAKYIIGTTLLSGIGVALPRIFHILAGNTAGAVFLPFLLYTSDDRNFTYRF